MQSMEKWLAQLIACGMCLGKIAFVKMISTSSVQFSHSVVSDSMWPHESQHTRPPCPSPTPGVHSNSHASVMPSSHLILCRPHQHQHQKNIYFCFIDYVKAFDSVAHNKLWKILKEMGIPDHLTCLLRNLYAGHEATVRTRHGTADWFQIRKGVCQGCILSPWLFNLYS